MKTPKEIIAERLGEGFSERRPASHGIITDCMKEYAKLWVEKSADVAMAAAEIGDPVGDAVLMLLQDIDAQ